MLDWDAPLSEQPGIINALRNSKSKIVRDTIKRMEDSGFKYSGDLGDYTGETLNRMLSLNFDGVSNSKKASDAFRKAGIPGIKYWDEGSRAAGEGSRNYVVFPGNENLITPLERNGEPLGLLGMGRKEKGL